MSSRTREASHAGSWYTDNGAQLSQQLDSWLDAVPSGTTPSILPNSGPVEMPTNGARVIVAPHAGYTYSGKAAAWAYKALDVKDVKRVFILGPSHHHYLTRCALSRCTSYSTPLGELKLDRATISELHDSGEFDWMSHGVDEAEHSIEMHLPYVYKLLSNAKPDSSAHPPIVPILVGNTSAGTERAYGSLLAPYIADPSNIFIVSSDFAHWGTRFRYTYYQPADGPARTLRASDQPPRAPPIHESIKTVDLQCVEAIEKGSHEEFLRVLKETGNTVCGRHPIGIVMAALEVLREQKGVEEGKGKFRFVRYERSSEVTDMRDSSSSVSYCSGFAVL